MGLKVMGMRPGRLAANVAGAGLGIWVSEAFVADILERTFPRVFATSGLSEIGVDDFVDGLCALLGAMVANAAYSKLVGAD